MNEQTGIYKKMSRVMGLLGRLPKSGWNDFHKYHYVTDADVMDAVRKVFSEVGLAFITSVQTAERDNMRVKVEVILTLADSETGETIAGTWFSEAYDKKGTDDKAIQKAVTAAVKYFLLKTFLISTGDEAQDAGSGIGNKPTHTPSPPTPPMLVPDGLTDEQHAAFTHEMPSGKTLGACSPDELTSLIDWANEYPDNPQAVERKKHAGTLLEYLKQFEATETSPEEKGNDDIPY